ncbi:MAG TPA: GNAT family N-acetyltransferase [Candidatus Sumerlaeota bacterium]|nr:GNAT family N-acetyltransferase [Candidatus Sumerlaeota bacterium]HPS01535.1 GNAT family N-acetyltransferase [Candidatus Sumerlaeota bacterium]
MTNEPSFRLREAVEEDVPRVVRLWGDMMREHEGFESRLRLSENALPAYEVYLLMHVRSSRSRVLVAEREDGGICGFCCVYVAQNLPMFEPRELGYISDLYVEPEHRRERIGRALIEAARQWFREQQVLELHLQVYVRNENGLEFWKSQGFEPFFQRRVLKLEEK